MRSIESLIYICLLVFACSHVCAQGTGATESSGGIDPAEWGSDHVDAGFPPYMTGDECLFCHRDIGKAWGTNRHQLSMRPTADLQTSLQQSKPIDSLREFVAESQFSIGNKRATVFLRKSKDYGKLELLSKRIERDAGEIDGIVTLPSETAANRKPHWDQTVFSGRCAGCHTTAVDTASRAFSAVSLDCFVCHGDVPLTHTSDTSKVYLSEKNRDAKQVISICGQCHLRGGRSKSTALPYPNTFVAGDNLFRDFEVDLSPGSWETLNQADLHVFQNSYEVAVKGNTTITCLSCHNIHGGGSEMHQELKRTKQCATCHAGNSDFALLPAWKTVQRYEDKSHVCGY